MNQSDHDPGDEDDTAELAPLLLESLHWSIIQKWAKKGRDVEELTNPGQPLNRGAARLLDRWRAGTAGSLVTPMYKLRKNLR